MFPKFTSSGADSRCKTGHATLDGSLENNLAQIAEPAVTNWVLDKAFEPGK